MPRRRGQSYPTISLSVPENDDTDPINISSFRELFTFSCYEDEIEDSHTDHSDIESNRATVDSSEFAMTASSNLPAPVQAHNSFEAITEDSSDNENDDEDNEHGSDTTPDPRALIIPGCPPSAGNLHQESRKVWNIYGVYRPELYFENLCYAAIEQGQLGSIKSAQFVTDVDTLWGLFATLHSKVSGYKHGVQSKKQKGLWMAVEVVGHTIFMKALNLHHCDDWVAKAATDHLKKDGMKWCNRAAVEGGWTEPQKPKAFNRVISYTFGDIGMVVQDDHQMLLTNHVCQALDHGVVKGPDGLE
ncbi:uncharacterized protein F4807DRAFT_121058 [Annulohypoxylon truncatum]|uniref:uncharacterized protein n=1 Tax=Annulohypoxylon truncatum TaxID=327061 RepID=UPI00200828D3|nr:uncharacterized protein F4807DRAFT_121058 [Annulohypoxylon truncatum]KAI1214301.1 hypothetical protein F4807DRAFT_121058 [Annulohypoxylon truncatum]